MATGFDVPRRIVPEMPRAEESLEARRQVFSDTIRAKGNIIQTLLAQHPGSAQIMNLAFQNSLMQGRLMGKDGAELLKEPAFQNALEQSFTSARNDWENAPLAKGGQDPIAKERMRALDRIHTMTSTNLERGRFHLPTIAAAVTDEMSKLDEVEQIPGLANFPAVQSERAYLTMILDRFQLPTSQALRQNFTFDGRQKVTDPMFTGPKEDIKTALRAVTAVVGSGLAVITYLMAKKMNKEAPDLKATMLYAAVAGLSVTGLKPFLGSRVDAVKDELAILQQPQIATYAKLHGENLVNLMETLFQNRSKATSLLRTMLRKADTAKDTEKKAAARQELKELLSSGATTDVERQFVTNAIDNDAENFVPFALSVLQNIRSDAAKYALYALLGKKLPDPGGGATPIV